MESPATNPGPTLDLHRLLVRPGPDSLPHPGPERTVVRGPFRPVHRSLAAGEFTLSPKPPWFVTNKTQATTGRRLTRFAAKPSWAKLPGIFASALRG